jgi:hypothetical protein
MWKRFQQAKSYNDLVEYKIARVRATKIYKNTKLFETKLANEVKKTTQRDSTHTLGRK